MRRLNAAAQLALWIGRKGQGLARLSWADRELQLSISGLQIVGVEGDDQDHLSAAFGLVEGIEWFDRAHGAVQTGQVSQAEANAVVKRAIMECLFEFLTAPDAQVSFVEQVQLTHKEIAVSFPHIIVELVLGGADSALVDVFLPDPNLVLRRLPDFPRRVGALALTEEAMAVLAKINDQRTALEIAERSPHGMDLAMRLLATAVGAGLAEFEPKISQVTLSTPRLEPLSVQRSRRIWPWFLGGLAILAVIVIAFLEPWKSGGSGKGGPFSIAVDGGCQPAELERLYRREKANPKNFQVVPFGQGADKCSRLVWGHFPTRAAAAEVIVKLPSGVCAPGFAPHVVEVDKSPR